MDELQKLGKLMRDDWDRRVKQDYRFWMSDGHESDDVMWASGRRDSAKLLRDIPADLKQGRYVEIGCGVGRLLPAALEQFNEVIGLDVSAEAIRIAGSLLPDSGALKLMTGNGINLDQIESNSVQVLASFAALISVPSEVLAAYLVDFKRVLAHDGVIRLQMYLGKEQGVCRTDTLHLRCYERNAFSEAVGRAGLRVQWIEELQLPFKVSFEELGITAVIVSLVHDARQSASSEEVLDALLPGGEPDSMDEGSVSDLECWMSLTHAQSLADQGNFEQAKEALEYAIAMSKTATVDISDTLYKIQQMLTAGQEESPSDAGEMFERNIRCLQDYFPDVANQLRSLSPSRVRECEVRETEEGPVIYYKGQVLDHAGKPHSAAQNWIKRSLSEKRISSARSVCIFGFAGGYHLEEWLKHSSIAVTVIEPHPGVLFKACQSRDFTEVFPRLSGLFVGNDGLKALDEETELLVRPQTQAVASEFCDRVREHTYGSRGLRTLKPQIGVLGPMQGGTLPIFGYTLRALMSLGQRVRPIDVSGFAKGYHEVSGLVTNELLQKKAHGSYVEMLSSVILNSLAERPVDILICMAQNPLSGDALLELRKRGVVTALWFTEDYLRFTSWKVLAPYYDYIFTLQKEDCINSIRAAGCPDVHYLPMACDPDVHAPVPLTAEEIEHWGSPISFVGAGYHNRQQTFASLANMPLKLWGTEWPTMRPFDRLVQEKGRRISPEEYVKIFCASKININLHSSTERDGVDPTGDYINPRAFELAACGTFQLSDTRAYLNDVFTSGEDIAVFNDTRELKDQIEYYLAHDEERETIAARGRATVLHGHTYQDRIRQMLSIIYRRHYERLKQRMASSPWHRILELTKRNPELQQRCQVAFERGEDPGIDALVSDIVTGKGSLSETEQKLLFLFHVSKQIIRMEMSRKGGE